MQDTTRGRHAGEEPLHTAEALETIRRAATTLSVPMVVGMSGAMASDIANNHTVGTSVVLMITLLTMFPGTE